MNKNGKIEDSLDFKKYEEDFEEMMQEMKDDPDYEKCKIPDDWDKEFRKAIDETLEKKQKEKRIRFLKRFGVAAAVIVAVMVGTNYSMEAVQGESLLEVLQSTFTANGNRYVSYENEIDTPIVFDSEAEDVVFECDTWDEVYQQVREEFQMPIFDMKYIPEGFLVSEAKYNDTYHIVNVTLKNENDYIYIFERLQMGEVSSGEMSDEEKCLDVQNTNLEQKISVYESIQDNSRAFSIAYKQMNFSVRSTLSTDECGKIAEGIIFQ